MQLHILQIASHHHFQHNEQLPVANVSVTINVIDLEGESQFLFLVAFGTEGAETRDEFLEVDITAAVFIEDGDHAAIECEVVSLGAIWAVRIIGVKVKYRVARGFDETWGSERNSSRSIVPELSCTYTEHGEQTSGQYGDAHTLSSFMNLFRSLSTSSRSTVAMRSARLTPRPWSTNLTIWTLYDAVEHLAAWLSSPAGVKQGGMIGVSHICKIWRAFLLLLFFPFSFFSFFLSFFLAFRLSGFPAFWLSFWFSVSQSWHIIYCRECRVWEWKWNESGTSGLIKCMSSIWVLMRKILGSLQTDRQRLR